MDIAKYDVGNDGSQWDSRFTRKGCRWISRIANAGLAVDYDLAPPNGAREEGPGTADKGRFVTVRRYGLSSASPR